MGRLQALVFNIMLCFNATRYLHNEAYSLRKKNMKLKIHQAGKWKREKTLMIFASFLFVLFLHFALYDISTLQTPDEKHFMQGGHICQPFISL